MSEGHIEQIIGAVIDVAFPVESVPSVLNALTVEEANLTLEVQQQMGSGVVRTIALGVTDGLKRGMRVTDTGDMLRVPVGEKTLGRIMDVEGKPIDEAGPIEAETIAPIHRAPPRVYRALTQHRIA